MLPGRPVWPRFLEEAELTEVWHTTRPCEPETDVSTRIYNRTANDVKEAGTRYLFSALWFPALFLQNLFFSRRLRSS